MAKAVRKLGAEILRFAQDDGLKCKSTPAGLKTGATKTSLISGILLGLCWTWDMCESTWM
jgi:hypothetical protein